MIFSNFFSRAGGSACAACAILLALALPGGCGEPRKGAPGADPRPAIDPALKRVEAIVGEVREVLPGLPSQGVEAPAWPDIPREEAPPRPRLLGSGRLIRAAGAEALPPALDFALHLDERELPGGFLLVTAAAGAPERWPILSADAAKGPGGDFSLTFRLIAPDNKLRYLSVVGVSYGTGELRFRSIEGYLIFPGAGGTLDARPPLYAIDFGYHWPLPPRHEARLAALKQASARMAERLEELASLDERAREETAQEAALRGSAVPAEQETRRRADLSALTARREETQHAWAALAEEIAAELERIYRERAGVAEDWRAFRASNPYRWMRAEERQRSAAPLAAAAEWRAGWRKAFDAVGGTGRANLAAARETMERVLLDEPAPAAEPGSR